MTSRAIFSIAWKSCATAALPAAAPSVRGWSGAHPPSAVCWNWSSEFREDLYYRINSFPIHIPALHERLEDLPLLVESLLKRLESEQPLRLHPDTLRLLRRYEFQGNIRELRNILEWASVMADDGLIRPQHLPDYVRHELQRPDNGSPDSGALIIDDGQSILSLKEMEQRYLQQLLGRYGGDKRTLAQALGISERTLYRKLGGQRA